MWDPVLDRLAAERDVLALDLPGFGGSPAVDGGLPRRAGGRGRRSCAGPRLERPHVAGNSLGGWVALELARPGGGVVHRDRARPGCGPSRSRPSAARHATVARALLPALAPLLRGRGGGGSRSPARRHPERIPPAAALRLVRAYAGAGLRAANV